MVLTVAHENVPVRHDGDSLEPLELGIARAPGAEGSQKAAIGMEDLDAVVARVGHTDVTLIIHRHTPVKRVKKNKNKRKNLDISY